MSKVKDQIESLEEIISNMEATKGEQFVRRVQVLTNIAGMAKALEAFTDGATHKASVMVVRQVLLSWDLPPADRDELVRMAVQIANQGETLAGYVREEMGS